LLAAPAAELLSGFDFGATLIAKHGFPRLVLSSGLAKRNSGNEKATRQQGGLFSRENSSNGGFTVKTFWRNLMSQKLGCQENF
jgi:hypothetical protein